MIRSKTARKLMYGWHTGQWSAFYAAASSGRVEDFNTLIAECRTIGSAPERDALMAWLRHQSATCEGATIQGKFYSLLPWGKP